MTKIQTQRILTHAIIFAFLSIVFLGFSSEQVSAQSATGPSVSNGGPSVTNDVARLKNPLESKTIDQFIGSIIEVLFVFAIPIIILFIMYAGFLFVTAQGDTGKVEDARRALLWAVVGGVVILGAKVIQEVISATVEGL